MKKQKGQALVEFALIVPLFFAMCFGMIYGGIMFLDYLQFNNAARFVARQISLTTNTTERTRLATDFEENSSEYVGQHIKLYTIAPEVTIESNSVTVEISLTLNKEDLPLVLSWINFPPEHLKPVKIVMPLESSQ